MSFSGKKLVFQPFQNDWKRTVPALDHPMCAISRISSLLIIINNCLVLFVWFLVGQYHFHNTASNKFILFQVHALDNVATVIENATNIFRVDGAREMRVTVDRV